MEQRCTCGAILPEDARFCHRCGKPQYAEDLEREALHAQAQSASQNQQQTAVAVESQTIGFDAGSRGGAADGSRRTAAEGTSKLSNQISFGNSRAVLISLLVAAGAMVAFLPLAVLAAPLFPFFLCAVGFVAVLFYRGRSPESLTTTAGARLGWMTGLWLFVVVVVTITMTSVFVASPEGWEQLRSTWTQVPQASPLLKLTQHEFLVQMLLTVPFSFFLLTLLPGLGGMLGAKFWARRRSL